MPNSHEVVLPEFTYPFQGEMHTGTTIIVSEPSFNHRRVYRRIKHAVVRSLMAQTGDDSKSNDNIDDEAVSQSPAEAPPGLILEILSGGFEDGDAWEQFLKAVKAHLTNTPELAHVAVTRAPLTDQLWNNIGLEAEDEVISHFLHFFFVSVTEKFRSASGGGKSTLSASPTAEDLHFPTPPRVLEVS